MGILNPPPPPPPQKKKKKKKIIGSFIHVKSYTPLVKVTKQGAIKRKFLWDIQYSETCL